MDATQTFQGFRSLFSLPRSYAQEPSTTKDKIDSAPQPAVPPPAPAKSALPWKRLVAGAVAGTADVWACHPLDRVKTHLQNNPHRSIMGSVQDITSKGQGRFGPVFAMYEGILPMTVEAIFKVGIRYFAFSFITEKYNETFRKDQPRTGHNPFMLNLLGGAFAGVVESFAVVIPCELLKVRHMTQTHNMSFGEVFKDVVKNEGVRGLYKGGSATFLRQATNHMIRFPVFYATTGWLKGDDHTKHLPVMQNLAAGALAGTCSTLVNNPLDTIKTRMQKQGQNQNVWGVIRGIRAEGGIRAFWAGVSTRILRVAPGQAITWAVVEIMLELMGEKPHKK